MIQLIIKALFPISLMTNLTVEALKKFLVNKKYSSNVLAAIVSVIISVGISLGYAYCNFIPFDVNTIATMIVLAWASFIMSTCGYDKATQLLKQLGELK